MVYTLPFFSAKCSLFHNSNLFGSCIIHILYTGVLKLKNNSDAKSLISTPTNAHTQNFYIKTFKIAPTCFDPKIIFRELHCLYTGVLKLKK